MKREIRVAIVDDESFFIKTLRLLFEKYSKENEIIFDIVEYDNGNHFVNEYKSQFDIVVLDIMMPEITGLEISKYIRRRDDKVSILFVTSIEKYMSEGFEVNALNYIIKPVQYEKFKTTIERAVNTTFSSEDEGFMVRNDDGVFKIYKNEIIYAETYERKVRIHRLNGDIVYNIKMKELEEILGSDKFYRCHSGYLVNLTYVIQVTGYDIFLNNGDVIPVSQNKKSGLVEKLVN